MDCLSQNCTYSMLVSGASRYGDVKTDGAKADSAKADDTKADNAAAADSTKPWAFEASS
jgi:hypothetical protein